MPFTDLQKKMLQDMGRSETGVKLLEVLENAKAHYSSINTIDKSRPAEPQIEGRELFINFIDELAAQIKKQPHQHRPVAQPDFS